MTIERFFPSADKILLISAERFFLNTILPRYPTIEAVVYFGSSLNKIPPKDVDFYAITDDKGIIPKQIDELRPERIRLTSFGNDYMGFAFIADFFFCVNTQLDPQSIRSIRIFNRDIDETILTKTRNGPCAIYTREHNVKKYQQLYPHASTVYISEK